MTGKDAVEPDRRARELATLPKCELHVHLEGALRVETLQRLAQRNGVDTPHDVSSVYNFGSFQEFARLFTLGLSVLKTAQDFSDAVDALAVELAEQNVRYAEVTTTAFMHMRRGVPRAEYVEGLNDGRRRAGARGIEIAWIVDIPRSIEPHDSMATVDFLLSPGAPDNVIALGLGGPEAGWPPSLYVESFDRARAAGLLAIPHAGETDGAERVREALDVLRADRIGHGVRASADPELLQRLAFEGTPLEVCVTSNVLLGVASDVETHPVSILRDAGVRITVNSDDPAYFATTLTRELEVVGRLLRLDVDGTAGLVRNAFEVSAMPIGTKRAALRELDALSCGRTDGPPAKSVTASRR
jgi:adenosine deaminase